VLTASRHREAVLLSWGWLGFQRICSKKLAALLGSPLPLWPWLALASEVFASSRFRKRYWLFRKTLSKPFAPLQSLLTSGAAEQGRNLARLPPMRFFPLRRLDDDGQPLIPGFTRPLGSVTFSAFLTLSRSCSAHHLPALFHAGPAHGVSLQGRFPPAEQCVLSNVRTLLWLSPKTLHFRVLLPASVLVPAAEADRTATLLGLTSLGVSPFSPWPEDHPLLSFVGNEQKLTDHCSPEFQRRKSWRDSLESATPFEVLHLVSNPEIDRTTGSGLRLGNPRCYQLG
jgi:hypothetical protein